MANTFTSLHAHLVFSTKNRTPRITAEIENEVWQYLGGICRTHGWKAVQIGGVDDHVHLLLGFPPTLVLSDAARRIKGESSKWISDKFPRLSDFAWQDGYGLFTIGHSQIEETVNYILRQREHHTKKTFAEEYRRFLQVHEIQADDRYIFG